MKFTQILSLFFVLALLSAVVIANPEAHPEANPEPYDYYDYYKYITKTAYKTITVTVKKEKDPYY
ncbi:9855_t:CDS:2, partial [Acaulospora morrowiae]